MILAVLHYLELARGCNAEKNDENHGDLSGRGQVNLLKNIQSTQPCFLVFFYLQFSGGKTKRLFICDKYSELKKKNAIYLLEVIPQKNPTFFMKVVNGIQTLTWQGENVYYDHRKGPATV